VACGWLVYRLLVERGKLLLRIDALEAWIRGSLLRSGELPEGGPLAWAPGAPAPDAGLRPAGWAHRVGSVSKGYYDIPSAAAVFDTRIAAVKRVLVPGSTILDLGCNDGRIATALLAGGYARHVTAVDLHDIVETRHEGFELIEADLRALDPHWLPAADAALVLNVGHHLLDAGPPVLRRLIGGLLERTAVVLVDMGSLTEPDQWLWRRLMGRWWASDEEMWADLFASARWRTPLCSYEFQGGRRTLWKLEGDRPPDYRYELVRMFRRTVGSSLEHKRLIEVVDETDEPLPFGADDGALCPEVVFRMLRRDCSEELFWAKEYTGGARLRPELQAQEESVHRFLKDKPFRTCLPRERHATYGHIYSFQPELFTGQAVHRWARNTNLSLPAVRTVGRFGEQLLDEGILANLPVHFVTDFQAVEHDGCVTFIDFEVNDRSVDALEWLLAAPTPSVLAERRASLLAALHNPGGKPPHDLFGAAARVVETVA
jgi:SAM-dependent methyltransferase